MSFIAQYSQALHSLLNKTRCIDFLGPLALRLYLAPIFLAAGFHKLHGFEDVVMWFGNDDWGLGLPFPWLMAAMATAAEIIGGFALIFGVAVRWMAVPLMSTMIVAAVTAHWGNGWFAIAPGNPETSMAGVMEKINFPGAKESLENSVEVSKRVAAAKNILRENGNYSWLTEKGNFVVLNNGIEFATTYFFMLLMLFFTGAGRFVSVDYWFSKRFIENSE